jgi:hypothetical protein
MVMKYLQIQPESILPDIYVLNPYRAVVVIEALVSKEWQWEVSDWLVKSGCLYMLAWGIDCSSWDDSVDESSVMEYIELEKIPDAKLIMTTWHENESLKDVFEFSKNWATHPTVEISNTIIIHISENDKSHELLKEYADTSIY